MTFKILKSQTFVGFDVAVAAFAKEVRDWREQENQAAAHDGKTDIDPKDRWVHRKRPTADPRVMQAINENDLADFEIINDDQTIEQILAKKKNVLLQRVSMAEHIAIEAVVPAGKRRIYAMRENDISAADGARLIDINKKNFLISTAEAIGLRAPVDLSAAIKNSRNPDDNAFLQQQQDRASRIDAITRAAAQMQSDIEDLTLDNIDAWKMPDFPK